MLRELMILLKHANPKLPLRQKLNNSYYKEEENSGNSERSWMRATESGGMMVHEECELEEGDNDIEIGET